MAYSKTPRARKPTEKAAAYSKNKAVEEKEKDSDGSDDDSSTSAAAPDSVTYSRKSGAHQRLKQMFKDGSFTNDSTLKQLYALDPRYRKYKNNTLRGAFGDLKTEFFGTREAVESNKPNQDEKNFGDEWMPQTKAKGRYCIA
jgi:hypothetical protein